MKSDSAALWRASTRARSRPPLLLGPDTCSVGATCTAPCPAAASPPTLAAAASPEACHCRAVPQPTRHTALGVCFTRNQPRHSRADLRAGNAVGRGREGGRGGATAHHPEVCQEHIAVHVHQHVGCLRKDAGQ